MVTNDIKYILNTHVPTIFAALMLLLTACSDEQYDNTRNPGQQPGSGAYGPLITLTATQGTRLQTRLGYDVPDSNTQPVDVTWAEGDNFFVGKDFSAFDAYDTPLSAATAYFSTFTLKEGEGGKYKADFTGSVLADVTEGATLYGIYGDGTKRITLNKSEPGILSFDYTNQRQLANDDKGHLSGADFMVATTTYNSSATPGFAFTHLGAMIKFTLTLPTEVTSVKQLTLATTDGSAPFSSSAQWDRAGALAFSKSKTPSASTTLLLGEEGTDTGITLPDDTRTLTAYMMVAPTTLTKETVSIVDKKYKLHVTDANGVIYSVTLKGTEIEQGKYYTVQASLTQLIEKMEFTIRLDASVGQDFSIPFPISGTTPAEITVDWGDGKEVTKVPAGTKLAADDAFKHTYDGYGDYTITITSSQLDATKQQIPEFRFGMHRKGFGEISSNARTLISMNTPMLNTGMSSFYNCFFNCANLSSLSEGLFEKNINATAFNLCFSKCANLSSLPADLFKYNTEATTFDNCFSFCAKLSSLPTGLFDKNTKAANFSSCFCACAFTTLPAGLFDKNTLVKTFESCFYSCEKLTSLPEGLFNYNTIVNNFTRCFSATSLSSLPEGLFDYNTQVTNFDYCFEGCASLKSLPEGLFNNNTIARGFTFCFNECTILILNETIFSSETDLEKRKLRFSGKSMDFTSCFQNTGSTFEYSQYQKSIVPQLWKYDKGGSSWTTTDCYNGCRAKNTKKSTDGFPTTGWGTPYSW